MWFFEGKIENEVTETTREKKFFLKHRCHYIMQSLSYHDLYSSWYIRAEPSYLELQQPALESDVFKDTKAFFQN